ncbi:MAG: hypothetical protein KF858_06735 [Candidatus Sumerlaeia bacterium]|nr:hypothetical protein [Candidatus Sumerlaeia bacterium]
MRPTAWLTFLYWDLRAHPGRAVVLATCTALGCFLSALAFQALVYLRTDLRPWIESLFPAERLVVRAGELDLAFLRFETGALTPETRDQIAALPGVRRVLGQVPARFPVSANAKINRIDFSFDTDIVLHGVPVELLQFDLEPGTRFAWTPGSTEPVPVAVSSYFLDMYNLGLAEGTGMPKLSRAAALGREFTMIVGESTLGLATSKGTPRHISCRVVALSSNPFLVGVSAPVEFVEYWNREMGGDPAPKFSLLHVDVADARDIDATVDAIRALRVRVEQPGTSLEPVRAALGGLEKGLGLAVLLVVTLAVVGIVSTATVGLRERRAIWGIRRTGGTTRAALLSLVAAEAALIGMAGAAVALAGLVTTLAVLRAMVGEWMEQIASIPGTPLALSPTAAWATVGLALVLVLVPALAGAGALCRREPADLLREQNA